MKYILTYILTFLISTSFGQVIRLQMDTLHISANQPWASKYESIEPFSPEGVAVAVLNDKYGYVDTSRHEMCPFIYDDILSFDKGVGAVSLRSK
ncbi:MAG: WG repeat-containing protein [Saprospiraceae bacterium]|nr:WG repeat-containing protein [Candidatus Brachybacter algidus]MBL0119552.1 WG repeat-containing protein [Candidatus Brachybacter algidus]